MGGGLVELSVAALLLVGSHFLLSSAPIRGRLVGAVGERGFLGLYSALALVLFIWLVWSYGRAAFVPLWSPPEGIAWLAILVMPLALLLLVGGYSQPNPTAVMQKKAAGDRPAPGVLAITRHPVMWAIGLWALVHLASSGDAASVILFGALAVLALAGTVVIDRKKRRSWGADWVRFAALTSNIPFAAILAGRARLHPAEIGWARLIVAVGLYVALLVLHPVIIGVPALPV